jgi:hypothetical protein
VVPLYLFDSMEAKEVSWRWGDRGRHCDYCVQTPKSLDGRSEERVELIGPKKVRGAEQPANLCCRARGKSDSDPTITVPFQKGSEQTVEELADLSSPLSSFRCKPLQTCSDSSEIVNAPSMAGLLSQSTMSVSPAERPFPRFELLISQIYMLSLTTPLHGLTRWQGRLLHGQQGP